MENLSQRYEAEAEAMGKLVNDMQATNYLIARSVEYSEDRSWVVFNLRPEARFHDGKPITAYDLAFSYRTLLKDGHPQYRTALQEVQRVDILNKTYRNHVVIFIADNFQFQFFPSKNGLFYKNLAHKTGLKTSCTNGL